MQPHWATIMLLLALVPPVVRSPRVFQEVNARDALEAQNYAEDMLETAPSEAFILTQAAEDTFPLWYMHFALQERTDLRIVVVPLCQFAWYRHNLLEVYPNLDPPDYDGDNAWRWVEALFWSNPRAMCRTSLSGTSEEVHVSYQCYDAPPVLDETSK